METFDKFLQQTISNLILPNLPELDVDPETLIKLINQGYPLKYQSWLDKKKKNNACKPGFKREFTEFIPVYFTSRISKKLNLEIKSNPHPLEAVNGIEGSIHNVSVLKKLVEIYSNLRKLFCMLIFYLII